MNMDMKAAIARHQSSNGEELESSVEDIEEGELAIVSPKKISELWTRPSRQPFPTDGKIHLWFEVLSAHIMPYENDKSIKKFVVYDISIRQDSTQIDPCPAIIERRYTDFRNLYNLLKRDYSIAMKDIIFPRKVFLGNFSIDLIAERSTGFESFLDFIYMIPNLRDSIQFVDFLQSVELKKACQFLDERRNELAVPILEQCFRLLSKIFMDRSKWVLLMLCRLVATCTTSPVPHPSSERWAELALRRFEGVCDTDLLTLYIPLLQTCVHLWWQRGRDNKLILQRLSDMSKRGIKISDGPTLTQAIHNLDPRTETF